MRTVNREQQTTAHKSEDTPHIIYGDPEPDVDVPSFIMDAVFQAMDLLLCIDPRQEAQHLAAAVAPRFAGAVVDDPLAQAVSLRVAESIGLVQFANGRVVQSATSDKAARAKFVDFLRDLVPDALCSAGADDERDDLGKLVANARDSWSEVAGEDMSEVRAYEELEEAERQTMRAIGVALARLALNE